MKLIIFLAYAAWCAPILNCGVILDSLNDCTQVGNEVMGALNSDNSSKTSNKDPINRKSRSRSKSDATESKSAESVAKQNLNARIKILRSSIEKIEYNLRDTNRGTIRTVLLERIAVRQAELTDLQSRYNKLLGLAPPPFKFESMTPQHQKIDLEQRIRKYKKIIANLRQREKPMVIMHETYNRQYTVQQIRMNMIEMQNLVLKLKSLPQESDEDVGLPIDDMFQSSDRDIGSSLGRASLSGNIDAGSSVDSSSRAITSLSDGDIGSSVKNELQESKGQRSLDIGIPTKIIPKESKGQRNLDIGLSTDNAITSEDQDKWQSAEGKGHDVRLPIHDGAQFDDGNEFDDGNVGLPIDDASV